MKLKRIELQGFKSFVDRTGLQFDEGITAILGPNGCGKSNIVDAVRWVLGEQSPKTLRGDRMDDVIFKGTTKRKPVGLAEVTLAFDNSDRRLSIEFDEVAVRRRVTREGNSEYYLNGTLCRLKDLRDLFYDSGVANTAYSIIEQAMINQVLNENNQELRRLIEEGSGITKYKARRREAQRKLDRTEQDLLRLNDIIEEIGREVRSLRYQVGKARRHQRLFGEIRALDLLVAERKHQQFAHRKEEGHRQLQELKTLAEADSGELAELRAQIEATRPAVDEREAERRRLEEALQAFEEELQESERQVFLLEHRIEEYEERFRRNEEDSADCSHKQEDITGQIAQLTEHLTTLAKELAGRGEDLSRRSEDFTLLEQRLVRDRGALEKAIQLNLEFIETDATHQGQLRELRVKQENRQERMQVLTTLKTQLASDAEEAGRRQTDQDAARERLAKRRRDLLAELARQERQVADLEAAATDIQARVSARVAKREALVSRHELLTKIKDEYRGYSQGSRRVLQEHGSESSVLGSVADRLQVAEQYTVAFENLFAETLDAVMVDRTGTAVSLVAELRQGESGQASFLCGAVGDVDLPTDFRPPADGRPATELVSGDGLNNPHLSRLLATTWLFENDDAAVAAAAAHRGAPPLTCLSRSGLMVTSDGVVRGGRGQADEVSLLGRNAKLEQLTAEIAAQETRIAAEQDRLQENHARREEVREAMLRGRGELEVLDADLTQLHAEIVELQSQRANAERRLAEIGREEEAIASMLERLAGEETGLRDQLEESGRQRSDSSMRRDELREAVESAEQERDAGRSEVEDLRLFIQRCEGEKREAETALSHLRGSLAEQSARQERLHQESELGRQERENLSGELALRKEQLLDAFAERERRRQIVRAAADAIQALHDQTAGWHDRIKVIEDKRGECRERMHAIDTDLATLDVQQHNLVERVEEQYKGAFRELIGSYDPDKLPKELERDGEVFQHDQAAELLTLKRDKLAALGPVNHLALEEYETKNERLQFLEGQQEDVEKARLDLATAIGRINRTAKKLFSETFEEVRRNFISVFQVLFEGGRADLQLIRTDDPLESNIHILAQPRGKVVNHVALLSGGERCLTALSLLFAVYLIKPSPFCMLDEVDAPLDDSNIQRFVRMLREFSRNTQFLVVTHNKLTMETANHLYGVTMMEEGVSSIVSVSFDDVADSQSDEELSRAIATRRRELDRRESVRAILADSEEEERAVRFTMAGSGEASGDGDKDGDSDGDGAAGITIESEEMVTDEAAEMSTSDAEESNEAEQRALEAEQ